MDPSLLDEMIFRDRIISIRIHRIGPHIRMVGHTDTEGGEVAFKQTIGCDTAMVGRVTYLLQLGQGEGEKKAPRLARGIL